jgi:hypothetical protein
VANVESVLGDESVLGTVVESSVGTEVATCGSWRDGPPGAVVEVARVVTGAVVDEPSRVVVDEPSTVVVDEPSATVVLEVSTGEIG